jgi:hypothetical protein
MLWGLFVDVLGISVSIAALRCGLNFSGVYIRRPETQLRPWIRLYLNELKEVNSLML